MARPIGPRKLYRYSSEFRATAVRVSELSGVAVQDVAQSLDVNPFLLSRWRRDAREGRLMTKQTTSKGLFDQTWKLKTDPLQLCPDPVQPFLYPVQLWPDPVQL